MPCVTDITASDEARHYETLLCLACRMLQPSQIAMLKNPGSGIMDGLDWYVGHVFCDTCDEDSSCVEKYFAISELNRLGYTIREELNPDGTLRSCELIRVPE
jgi:hypothetical protein